MIQIFCDCCKHQIEREEYITLGSETGKELKYSNTIQNEKKEARIAVKDRYSDLHFCNKDCFVDYFFHKEEKKDLGVNAFYLTIWNPVYVGTKEKQFNYYELIEFAEEYANQKSDERKG